MKATRLASRLSVVGLCASAMALLLGVSAPAKAIPIADADGPYTGFVGDPIALDGSGSFDLVQSIVLFEWDFEGDGTFDFASPSVGVTAHTYTVPGVFNATLRVTNALGQTDFDTTTARVVAGTLIADANGPYTGLVGDPIALDGSGSFDLVQSIVLFEWDFESDGTFDFASPNSAFAAHTYAAPGLFDVTLKVTNDLGQIDSDSTVAIITAASSVPEPGTLALFVFGLAGLGSLRWCKRGHAVKV